VSDFTGAIFVLVMDSYECVRSEVFMAVTLKSAVFWDVAPCRSYVIRRIGGMSAATCSLWFLARGFFYPEDGGNDLDDFHDSEFTVIDNDVQVYQ
jgi:hypothetical protein